MIHYRGIKCRLAGAAALTAIAVTLLMSAPAEAKKRKVHYYGPQTSFSGTVVARRHGKHGNVSGVVLSSGVVLHFPRHEAARASALKVGQSLSGTGYWTHRREGRVIAPTSLR
jgi:hypothetical protein